MCCRRRRGAAKYVIGPARILPHLYTLYFQWLLSRIRIWTTELQQFRLMFKQMSFRNRAIYLCNVLHVPLRPSNSCTRLKSTSVHVVYSQ